MHELLAEQLRRFFGGPDAVPETVRPFVAAVETVYREADRLRDERKRLDETMSLLTATLESTTDGILVVDVQGKIVRMNRKFAELWRIPPHILDSGKDDQALAFVLGQLEDPQGFLHKVRELYDHPDAESFDVLPFRDGRVFERYSLPQQINGATVGRVWSFRDVTEQRKLEDQLLQSHKMEAIGLLAGGIAHDFNNLLTVIRGNAELLERALDRDAPQRLDAVEIIEAATRATELARQLLAFGRKQLLQSVHFDLNQVLADVQPMLRRLIGEDVAIRAEPAEVPCIVSADRGQLEQVLVNLVINARDAMPNGGTLTIATAPVTIGDREARKNRHITPPGEYIRLTVSDTGVGIPRDQLDRIFEPFYTTKELGKGTGLGLSTLYGIVKQSGGHVTVESTVGAGTTFSIHLPRAVGTTITAPPVALARPEAGGSEVILVAEDADAVRRLILRVLQGAGYTVLSAHHGNEALAQASKYPGSIDLLLTDVIMPELGGVKLVERLRQSRPAIRVLYMSGHTDSDIDRQGVLHADASFLQKPFTGTALSSAVRASLDGAPRPPRN